MGVRDTIAKAIMGIKAYHSSPHDFDKFSLSKIGTGEGAQAYGHGLYFAENPKVSGQGGQYWNQFLNKFSGDDRLAADFLQSKGFDRSAAIEANNQKMVQIRDFYKDEPATAQKIIDRLRQQNEVLASGAPVGPRTYEVNIKADPAQMLNWDKSMSAQPEVMNKIRPLFSDYRLAPSNYLGESVHKEIRDFHMGQGMSKPAAAEATAIDLRSSGIPGIKYLDEGSRGRAISNKDALWQEPLTSNYVIFDPSIIDIAKKYAVPGAVGTTGVMGAIADQGQYQPPDPMAGTINATGR